MLELLACHLAHSISNRHDRASPWIYDVDYDQFRVSETQRQWVSTA